MNTQQLDQLIEFVKPYYFNKKAGKFHDWRHIEMVLHAAEKLAHGRNDLNINLLKASCYIHDIGRVVSDETHPKESMKIATPYLVKLGVSESDINIIGDSVLNHGIEKILSSVSVEAKLLFDADKLQIISLYGFIRVWGWLVEERGMDIDKAMVFLHEYVHNTYEKYLQTQKAKKIAAKELKKIDKIVSDWKKWNGYNYNNNKL
jgi:HD superfamily phosphodiesterase